jgi:hypothetical protein
MAICRGTIKEFNLHQLTFIKGTNAEFVDESMRVHSPRSKASGRLPYVSLVKMKI